MEISFDQANMLRLSGTTRIPMNWFGRVLKFQVIDIKGSDITLRGQGQTVKAKTTVPLQLGQEVQVRAEAGREQVLLRLLNVEKTPVEVLRTLDLSSSAQRLNLVQELIALKQPLSRELILALERELGDVKEDPLGHLFLRAKGIPVNARSLAIWRFLKDTELDEIRSLYVMVLEEYVPKEGIPYTLQYWGYWPFSLTGDREIGVEEKKYLLLQIPTENLGLITVLLSYMEKNSRLMVSLGSSNETVREVLRSSTGELFRLLNEDFQVEAIDVLATEKKKHLIKGLDVTI